MTVRRWWMTLVLVAGALAGCEGATLGNACENMVALCGAGDVDTCVDVSFASSTTETIVCAHRADTCDAAAACGLAYVVE